MNTIHVTKHKDGRLAVVKKPTADSVEYIEKEYILEECKSGARVIKGLKKEAGYWKAVSVVLAIIAMINFSLIFIL